MMVLAQVCGGSTGPSTAAAAGDDAPPASVRKKSLAGPLRITRRYQE